MPEVVMITGAAGNLGRAVSRFFAERGCNLILIDKAAASAELLPSACGQESLTLQADLRNAAKVEEAVRLGLAQFGRIHFLCNLAGGFRSGSPLHETSDADWDYLFDLNTRSILNTARAVVPRMVEAGGGKIVNVAAGAAEAGAAGMAAYSAAKSAVVRLTEAMAMELRQRRINVNCVLPSIIDTPENRAAMPDADAARWVAPSDLARVIGFLASEDAVAVHGAAIPVRGLS